MKPLIRGGHGIPRFGGGQCVGLVSACRRQNLQVPPTDAPLTGPRLAALFVAGLLLLNFPLLALWDHPVTVWGLPLLPAALFAIWAGLIAVLAWLLERLPD
jgi:hypothetical protein